MMSLMLTCSCCCSLQTPLLAISVLMMCFIQPTEACGAYCSCGCLSAAEQKMPATSLTVLQLCKRCLAATSKACCNASKSLMPYCCYLLTFQAVWQVLLMCVCILTQSCSICCWLLVVVTRRSRGTSARPTLNRYCVFYLPPIVGSISQPVAASALCTCACPRQAAAAADATSGRRAGAR